MKILSGKDVSKVVRESIKERVGNLDQAPGLGVILVGEDPASQVYVKNKLKACESVGMRSFACRLPEDASEEALSAAIKEFNENPNIDGYLVQLPLPAHLDKGKALSWIDPKKDADGLTIENIGLFHAGHPRSIPCTPHGVMRILEHYDYGVEGKKAVVIGRSHIVGQPMAQLLMNANATVTVCHSRTKNLEEHTLQADIVVVAAGKPKFIGRSAFKKGAIVIDVGIHRQEDGKLCGDVDPKGLDGHIEALTPVPGGVGPMTITMLLENTLRLSRKS